MVKSVNTNKVEMDKKAAIAVVFENSEFGKVRTLTDENGEPLFCAKDLCSVLGYKRANDAVDQLVKPLDTAKRRTWVATGLKKDGTSAMRRTLMLYVNESGFYALVLGSKLSTAVKFKNWVTADVLPQILLLLERSTEDFFRMSDCLLIALSLLHRDITTRLANLRQHISRNPVLEFHGSRKLRAEN